MFVTVGYLHPSITFVTKAGEYTYRTLLYRRVLCLWRDGLVPRLRLLFVWVFNQCCQHAPLHLGDLIFAQLVHRLNDVIFVYTLAQCYETFYGRNLQMLKISESVVPARPFQPSLMFVCKARRLY